MTKNKKIERLVEEYVPLKYRIKSIQKKLKKIKILEEKIKEKEKEQNQIIREIKFIDEDIRKRINEKGIGTTAKEERKLNVLGNQFLKCSQKIRKYKEKIKRIETS